MTSSILSAVALLSLSVGSAIAHPHAHDHDLVLPRAVNNSLYKIDIHRHVIPDLWVQALIEYNVGPIEDGLIYTDGIPVPLWNLTNHIEVMDSENVGYATVSVASPGVSFMADNPVAAATLARNINLEVYNYTQQYPTRLGGICLLPLPDIAATLLEIEYCLDVLKFDGIGMYSNVNGIYLGDRVLDPVFDLIQNRSATVFVHPVSPACMAVTLGWPVPVVEYAFEDSRAIANMLLTGQRDAYSNINMVIPQGGGTIPFIAPIIAGISSFPYLGSLDLETTLSQLAGYIVDTASASSAIQLFGMKNFMGVESIVLGTDFPYTPASLGGPALDALQVNGNFSDAEMEYLNHKNALRIFPTMAEKLKALGQI